jgi:4-hydroxythreonine-4-phosphate dehydrogenase
MERPIVLITMGDPAGVGPEVIVKSVNQPAVQSRLRPLVIGDTKRLRQAVELTGVKLAVRTIARPDEAKFEADTIDCLDWGLVPPDLAFGRLSPIAGEAAFCYIAKAVEVAQSGFARAICTAPLNKEALHAAGHRYPGHTELLARLSGTPEVSMLLVAPKLRVIHVTTHIGILDAIARIEPGLVERTLRRGNELLVRAGMPRPRIAVCGINPHAGEGGLFGRGEEAEKIVPAVQACVRGGLDVQGPLPADTLFFRARRGDFDLIVAMYHDQGHGPVKVLGLEAGVNVTVGLPFVRTSVDHGTAFDIAGTGRADAGSMIAALELAAEFCPKSPAA